MADQNINIKIKADSSQVQAAAKSTEGLKQEIRRLEKELTTLDINDARFGELSEQLKDNRDQLELVRAKSRDLFESFSLLPGPIGAIGSATDQSLGKLKILSSFNLKDVKGQFKAIGDDIKNVGSNLGITQKITKAYQATVGGLSKAFTFFGASAKTASTAANGFAKALAATGVGLLVVGVGMLIANFDKLKDILFKLIPGLSGVADFIGGIVNRITDFIGVTSKAQREQEQLIASLEKGLKKQQQSWDANADKYDEFTQRKVAANQKFKEKQIEILKDETLAEAEKNKLLKDYRDQADREINRADADRAKKNNEAAKAEIDKNKQKAQQIAADNKAARQAELDAKVQNIKNEADTDEKALRDALKAQYDLRNEGKKLSVEQRKLQADEINQIVKDELNKDKETRQKAFDDRIKEAKEESKLVLETLENETEAKKIQYGEDSKEYRAALQLKFDKDLEIINNEEAILKEKEKTKDGLTQDEIRRLKELQNERMALANTVAQTNQDQINSDIARNLKLAEEGKAAADIQFQQQFQANSLNLQEQTRLLTEKQKADELYFQKQLEVEGLNEEQRNTLRQQQLDSQTFYAEQEFLLEQKKVAVKLNTLDNIVSIVGAESAVGRAALVAKQVLLAKELFLEAKKTITFATLKASEATVATATGAAKTAAVGFPQNIPLLIAYAAQAAGIIAAIVSAVRGAKSAASGVGGADTGGGGTPAPDGGASVPKPKGLASGGVVYGPGGGKSDLIPAMLSNGESVINANSTAMFRPLLSSINAIGGGKRFAEGGVALSNFTQAQSMGQLGDVMAMNSQPIRTYVVAQDMTNQQMMDREIKTRSTI